MRFLFEAKTTVSELELEPGTWTVGGDPRDGVRFPGLPPALATVEVSPTEVWVRCRQPLRLGRAVLEADLRRLLLPGEALELGPGTRLRLPDDGPPAATAALLQSLALGSGTASRSAAPRLVCVAGLDAGAAFPLAGPAMLVGRHPECAVRLREPAVSRRHARVERAGSGHRLVDLGGPNPTRRNGRRLRAPVLLEDGDVVTVGRTLLRYAAGEADRQRRSVGLVVRSARRPRPTGPRLRVLAIALGLGVGVLAGRLVLSASARGRRAPPAIPSGAGDARRSW